MHDQKKYIAEQLFNAHERTYLELIASELEGKGYKRFLPHRDQSGIDESEMEGTNMSQATKDKIFNTDLTALNDADLTVALMTGQDIDSGTAAEIGFPYASNPPTPNLSPMILRVPLLPGILSYSPSILLVNIFSLSDMVSFFCGETRSTRPSAEFPLSVSLPPFYAD